MRSLGFLIGVSVGWLGARLVGDRSTAAQQGMLDAQRALDFCRQNLAERTAEVERLRAEMEKLQTELDALRVSPPSVPARFADPPTDQGAASVPAPVPDDDLTIVEGIGTKIAALLMENGIRTFADLAAASQARLREILAAGGPRFRMANPSTWPQQAGLAARGAWDELTAVQRRLKAGVEGSSDF